MNKTITRRNVPALATLRIYIFYTDFPAAVQAKALIEAFFSDMGAIKPLPEFWKLDSIPPMGPLRDSIIKEASTADVWMIACSSPGEWDAMIAQWMNRLNAGNADRQRPLLVGLLGTTSPDRKIQWLLDLLSLLAERTGQEFVWHPLNRDTIRNLDWIRNPIIKLFGGEPAPFYQEKNSFQSGGFSRIH